ncbi:MAG: Peptidase, M16 family [Candidatus Jorgensenbacteria bacterium GW2011_GWA1_48_11]|uniref:Peptidase, M16 family n=1 Tax=Candidatus Jorgensenbacteria bacterium GW2011_GWA1_48_11 TaxID=1618660 RepID=A0A0G1XBG8_9BACT|nr:MAG: Peptidase, M16 family [Candidatus Jorgensenbacteria bacterium GW2011_GWA1_48_11]KKW12132.1 MAG: Peptidase, M16 family [Candidatus Jorgensenbacteria bacterium GW2011_GWB1_49_9]
MEKSFEKKVLANGLRVILVPESQSLATTALVLVEAGSKYETKDINGLSHFLEHICFKGTKARPRAIDIASELDGLGAQYNAFTSQEYTGYYTKVRNEKIDKALEIITDLYIDPVFDEKEIEKEKGVIIEEMNLYEDTPYRKIQDLFLGLVYGDQPAGWAVLGRKEVILKLKRSDFLAYRRRHYLPQSTVVIVAGGFQKEKMLEQIEAHFSKLPGGGKEKKIPVAESQSKPEEIIRFKESDQTHLVLGFRAFSAFDERKYALEVLADILGGGMGSRLFQKIREEMGAAYYVRASTDLSTDHGLMTVSAGVQHQKVEAVIQVILEEFNRLAKERVLPADLQRAKEHLVGNLFLSLETSDETSSFYGVQEIMGLEPISPQAVARKIQAVTSEEIQAAAKSLFNNESLNLALIGPFKEKTFIDILKV